MARTVGGLWLESTTELVLVVDRQSDLILSANVAASELLACEVDAVVGRPFAALLYEQRDVSMAGHYEDFALRRSDDYPIYVELEVVHVVDPTYGELAAYIARDTTERRQLQLELLANHSALVTAYAELERVNRELVRAKHELEARNREIASLSFRATLGELVANVAHHLNNPVAALSSTVRRLETLHAQATEPRPEHDKLLARIARLTGRIESSVAAIVSASRAAIRGSPSLRPPELARELSSFAAQLVLPSKDLP